MVDHEFDEDEAEEPSEPDLDDEPDGEFDPDLEEEDLGAEALEDLDEGVAETEEDDEDEVVDLEEPLHPDDVEEPLDVLLLERTSSGLLDEEDYDDDDDADGDDRSEPGARIPPKRPGEFVCRSCFLVKHPSQLADATRLLCTDCV